MISIQANRRGRRVLLAAGLLVGAAAMTGCAAVTSPTATSTPEAQITAEPSTDSSNDPPLTDQTSDGEPSTDRQSADVPESNEQSADEEEMLSLLVDGRTLRVGAVQEADMLLLPLVETAEALGWDADSEQLEDELQMRRTVTLDKADSRITVSWTVSDNTAKQITWQRDGLLIPVDTRITTRGDVVYVPAAFFETAMDVQLSRGESGVVLATPQPEQTPETMEQKE